MKRIIALLITAVILLFGYTAEDFIKGHKKENIQNTPDGKMRVFYLDVGQGDSTFILLPNGKSMLIDAGEQEYGVDVIRAVKAKGVKKIDYLIASHPHSDHIGGMAQIVNHFDIGSIYMPKVTTTTDIYQSLLNAIGKKNMKINTAKAGVEIFREDDLSATFVAPNSDHYDDLNNFSAVIKLTYKNNSFLFTGDAEKIAEDEIRANIKCDVLKVGHHGSNSSTTYNFLKKTEPKYAVISCGIDNEYGHPTEKVLSRLKKANVNVYRTDLQGTIEAISDGENISFITEEDNEK